METYVEAAHRTKDSRPGAFARELLQIIQLKYSRHIVLLNNNRGLNSHLRAASPHTETITVQPTRASIDPSSASSFAAELENQMLADV